jgi:hypothetical protein
LPVGMSFIAGMTLFIRGAPLKVLDKIQAR